MLITIFDKNNVKPLILKNKNSILKPPKKAPIIILIILTFLLNIMETHKSNRKSIPKFKIINKSKYIFIISPI